MNTVRSCFATTVAFLVVAIGWLAADAVVCCNSSSVASGGGGGVAASCRIKNQTFHTVEAIGSGTCNDDRTAVPVWKCCPRGQLYHMSWRTCQPATGDGDEEMQRMMQLLRDGSREMADAVMVGYNYEHSQCDAGYVLVDLPAVEVPIERYPLKFGFPPGYCFDLTQFDELVALACRPRDQICFQGKYTCFHSCCQGNWMVVDGPNGPQCKQSDNPFMMGAYIIRKTYAGHLPVYARNVTVLPYYEESKCLRGTRKTHNDIHVLTTNGSLYFYYTDLFVPEKEYCMGHSETTGIITTFICNADNVLLIDPVSGSSIPFFYRATYVASAVCLALALLVYNTLPSLRNIRNYYVKCYMGHQFMTHICAIAQFSIENKEGNTCFLFGYISLFVFLSTLCWLNVICFDIYWMIRYNISINRNTSTSVRTIMYHIYCWGLSSIFVCIGLYFEFSQDEWLQQLSPDFLKHGCFYYHMSGYGGIIFILIPVFVMLTANLILLLLITLHCSRIKNELSKFNPTDSKTENFLVYKEKFFMSIKLFLIMGIPFFLTILSISLRTRGIKWYIIYAASSLQGVLIFIIFVAKRNVIMDLRKNFNGFNGSLVYESTQINTLSGSS